MPLALPNINVRQTHALTMRVRGRVIGACVAAAPNATRGVVTEYDLGPHNHGLPREIIPQTQQGTLRLERYDLYPLIMEEVFGDDELVNLTDQVAGFELHEIWGAPGTLSSIVGNVFDVNQVQGVTAGALRGEAPRITAELPTAREGLTETARALLSGTTPRRYVYTGCWFGDVGRTLRADDTRVVLVNATIHYTRRKRVY